MPDNRQVTLQPIALPVQQPVEQRIAQQIKAGLGPAINTAANTINAQNVALEMANNDKANVEKYLSAGQVAAKQLDLGTIEADITGQRQAGEMASAIVTGQHVLAEQERVGPIMANISGLTSDQLVQYLKTNPGVIDPTNQLYYRDELAKQMAVRDVATIFQNVAKDQNSLSADPSVIQQTVNAKVNEMADSKNGLFPDNRSKQAYLSTLYPIAAEQTHSLMLKAWDTFRTGSASAMAQDLNYATSTAAQKGLLDYPTIDNNIKQFSSWESGVRKFVPEINEPAARQKAMDSITDALTGEKSPLNPITAKQSVDKIVEGAGGSINKLGYLEFGKNSKVPDDTQQWLSNLFASSRQNVRNYQQNNQGFYMAQVNAETDRGKLMSIQAQADSDAQVTRDGTAKSISPFDKPINGSPDDPFANKLSPADAQEISKGIMARDRALQGMQAETFKTMIAGGKTQARFQEIRQQINSSNFAPDIKAGLDTEFQNQILKMPDRFAFDAIFTHQPGSESIAPTKAMEPFMDEAYQQMVGTTMNPITGKVQPGVPNNQAYGQMLGSMGFVSDKMKDELSKMPIIEAISTFATMKQVNPGYTLSLVNDKALGLNPRVQVATGLVTYMGYSSQEATNKISLVDPGKLEEGWAIFAKPESAIGFASQMPSPIDLKIKDSKDAIASATDPSGLFNKPDRITTGLTNAYMVSAAMAYAEQSASQPGIAPNVAARNAQAVAEKEIGKLGMGITLGGYDYAIPKENQIGDQTSWANTRTIFDFVARAAVARGQMPRLSEVMPDLDNIHRDDALGTATIDIYPIVNKIPGRPAATITIPTSPAKINELIGTINYDDGPDFGGTGPSAMYYKNYKDQQNIATSLFKRTLTPAEQRAANAKALANGTP